MPAPTQALPPYLSYSTSLITRPGGGVKTSTTLVEVPLTYYGPSVSVIYKLSYFPIASKECSQACLDIVFSSILHSAHKSVFDLDSTWN